MDKKFLLLFSKRSACLLFLVWTATANAEITINPQALDPTPPPASTPASKTPVPKVPAPRPPAHPAPPRTAAVPPPRKPPPIIVPPAPPPVPVLQPLVPPPPAHTSIAPEPAPVVADAKGEVDKLTGGTRILFGAGSSDLNAEMDHALRQLARESPQGIFNVVAFAAGVPDDPSTPRRLSLSRALAARSLLIAEGIPSTHIYVRALGPNAGEGPPDRADVTVAIPPPPAASTTAPSTAPTPNPPPPANAAAATNSSKPPPRPIRPPP